MHIVTNPSFSMMMVLYGELIRQSLDFSEKTAENQVNVKTAVLNQQSSIMFHSNDEKRYCWAVYDSQHGNYLVWFAYEQDIKETSESNFYPDIKKCRSVYIMHANRVLEVVNDFIVDDKLPEYTMPINYVPTTSGFDR